MIRRTWIVAAVCCAASPHALPAQRAVGVAAADTVTARVGDRVRVNVPAWSPDRTGTLTRVTPESLWVQDERGGPAVGLARATVRRVEVSRGVPGRTRRGWLGAGVGAVAVGVLGHAVGRALGEACGDCSASGRGAWIGSAAGAAAGAGLGALLGSAGGRERWVAARLPGPAPAGARGAAP